MGSILSALLRGWGGGWGGEALDVYDRSCYGKLKVALFRKFEMTDCGFRQKFRYTRHAKSKTICNQ